MKANPFIALVVASLVVEQSAPAFEGRITAAVTRGSQATPLLYTVGTNFLRVDNTATNLPNPVDVVNRSTGELTLLFPHNGTFVRLKAVSENASSVPPGVGPQPPSPAAPPSIGPTNLPGIPAAPPRLQMPAMPRMPPPMMEKMELTATGDTTNLLGFPCARYLIKQRFETMEIWATDKLPGFQPYLQRQPRRIGPHPLTEQWGDLVKARELFPLLAVLKFENGAEQMRFEVKSITPQELTKEDEQLFQPPAGYIEIQPLPF